jgi:hypothetical protein
MWTAPVPSEDGCDAGILLDDTVVRRVADPEALSACEGMDGFQTPGLGRDSSAAAPCAGGNPLAAAAEQSAHAPTWNRAGVHG